MVELAVLGPVIALLVLGLLDLGRVAYFKAEAADAARDGGRVFSAQTTAGNGPGLAAICTEVARDLSDFASVDCRQAGAPPPYTAGSADYPSDPALGSAMVLVYCGDATDCQSTLHSSDLCDSTDSPPQHTCGSVTVYYAFQLLTPIISAMFGDHLTLHDTGSFVSAW